MRGFRVIGTAFALSAIAATGALAADFEKYGSEAGWDVMINKDMGNGCLITQTTPDGMQVQMGIDNSRGPDARTGYIALYSKDKVIGSGDVASAEFDVDGRKFSGAEIGEKMSLLRRAEGYHGAWAPVDNPEFVYDIAKKNTLTITPAGGEPIAISLSGTNAAMEMMRQCQQAQ